MSSIELWVPKLKIKLFLSSKIAQQPARRAVFHTSKPLVDNLNPWQNLKKSKDLGVTHTTSTSDNLAHTFNENIQRTPILTTYSHRRMNSTEDQIPPKYFWEQYLLSIDHGILATKWDRKLVIFGNFKHRSEPKLNWEQQWYLVE